MTRRRHQHRAKPALRVVPFAARLELASEMAALVDKGSDRIRAVIGTGLCDQLDAAARNSFRHLQGVVAVLPIVDPGRHWTATSHPVDDRRSLHLQAALYGCQPCPHVSWRRPDIVICDLNRRVVLCRRCAQTVRRPIDDRRCEICDGHVADNTFQELLVQFGHYIVHGNVGVACCGWLLTEEAA